MTQTNSFDHRGLASDNLSDGPIQNIQYWNSQNPAAGNATSAAGTTFRSSLVATTPIAATETLILAVPLVAGVTLKVGSIVRATVSGTYTSAGAQTATFTWRAGTLGTVSDTSLATFSNTSAGSGSAIAFAASLDFVVQTLGTGTNGTFAGHGIIANTGTTGISTTAYNAPLNYSATAGNFPTATFLDLTMLAGTSNSASILDAYVEIIV